MIVAGAIGAAALNSSALGGPKQEPHYDAYIYTEDGRIKTGAILEEDAGTPGGPDTFVERVRVFGAEMGEDFPNFGDEPGFDGEASFFPNDPTLGFRVHGALREWNGADFDAVSSSTITIDFLANSVGTPAGLGDVIDGFEFDPQIDDTYHLHFDFTLNAPQSGIFLLLLSLQAPQDPALEGSKFFAFVFNNGFDEEEHEAAIHAAHAYIPAPGPAFALGALSLVSMRRRR
jgi:hypothetical protein